LLLNALTIDIEDYWSILSRDWLHIDAEPSDAVVRNTEWFLQTLARHNVKATFFILGEVAERFPSLIKKIAADGHEIGSHGFSHKQIFKLSEEQFRREVVDCKKLLEDITSSPILGYRAPAFSIMPQTKWALEILAQEGFEYDSSVYPICGKRYGWPGFSKGICKIDLPSGRSIIEVPMSTVTIFGKTLPVAGGGYIRHFPYAVTRWAIKYIQKTRPVIVYMHPYEIDTELQPFSTEYLAPEDKSRGFKHHKLQLRNRHTVPRKVNKLLSQFDFAPLKKVISESLKVALG
jgi:polysaccharide deacetylase family protein (PEP-CTERM system associated)